jgi:hypothetical protein
MGGGAACDLVAAARPFALMLVVAVTGFIGDVFIEN